LRMVVAVVAGECADLRDRHALPFEFVSLVHLVPPKHGATPFHVNGDGLVIRQVGKFTLPLWGLYACR
jgi:hypothetical protein